MNCSSSEAQVPSDLPTTAGCLDNTFGGGTGLTFIIGYGYDQPDGTDMFVAHFNSTATALIGSTYIGGPENDGINNDPFARTQLWRFVPR